MNPASSASTPTAPTATHFFTTTLGKKVVMAVTGVIMFGYLVGHLAGNVQVFRGAASINDYAAFLHHSPGILWGTRLLLIASVVLHIWAAIQLYALKVRARGPVAYSKKGNRGASLSSRIMIWTGYGLAAFIVYHLLHFTTGTLHSDFVDADVHHNMISAFHRPEIALLYVVAMVFVAMHLQHGLFSMTQSLGLSHPRYANRAKVIGIAVAIILAAGFALIPIAVIVGITS